LADVVVYIIKVLALKTIQHPVRAGMNAEEFVKIAVIDNEVEAGLLASILKERGIAHILRTYRDTAYNGLFQMQKGWGEVRAPLSEKSEILNILREIRISPVETTRPEMEDIPETADAFTREGEPENGVTDNSKAIEAVLLLLLFGIGFLLVYWGTS
jgi:hypothetical protein